MNQQDYNALKRSWRTVSLLSKGYPDHFEPEQLRKLQDAERALASVLWPALSEFTAGLSAREESN